MQTLPTNKYSQTHHLNRRGKKVLKTTKKEKSFPLHNDPSTRPYILDKQKNNFQSASPNIATASKTGQTTPNLQNIVTKVTT